ncbi:MAG: Imm26 family immunity protein, partial [Rhodanobacteraceae bacterium]
MKLPYSEGSTFLVPLKNGGFARGVVARASPKGRGVMGYFFGPRLSSKDGVTWNDLDPSGAILRIRFGDLGLINGEWPICGQVPNWNRDDWPMPDFVRRDPLGCLKPKLVRYADDDPMRIEVEYPIDDDSGMLEDVSAGYGAVEIRLSKVLGLSGPSGYDDKGKLELQPSTRSSKERKVDHYLYFPKRTDALSVAAVLRKDDFVVETKRSADDKNWLVLARHI